MDGGLFVIVEYGVPSVQLPVVHRDFPKRSPLYFNVIATFIYLVGAIGGVLLMFGKGTGARILRLLALFFVIVCVVEALEFGPLLVWRLWCAAVAVFSLITIGVLHQHLKSRQPLEPGIQ